jgi:hypothetical protein
VDNDVGARRVPVEALHDRVGTSFGRGVGAKRTDVQLRIVCLLV